MTGQFAVRQSQRGVTIVELMVAMTLGLVAIGGAAAIYLANRQSFATVQGVARIEEGARFAADLLARDIREAGNSVCGGAMSSSNLVTSPIPNWATWDRGLLGNALADTDVVATSVAGPAAPATRDPNSDSLLVWSASAGGDPVRITAHTTGASGTFTTATPHGFAAGAVVVACDSKQLLTFEVQSPGTSTLGYSGGPSVKAFLPGGWISPLTTHLWYVGGSQDVAGALALRRITIDKSGTKVANDEMITGVSKMQVKYLVADPASRIPIPAASYQTADTVPTWDSVIAVQIRLTLSSLDKINPAGGAASVYLHTLPMTVALRRRMQP